MESRHPPEARVIEIARFALKPDASAEALLAAARRVERALRNADGFLGRELARDDDANEWIDIVRWRDERAAKGAQEAMMTHPDAQPFFALMEPDSVRMRHLTRPALE